MRVDEVDLVISFHVARISQTLSIRRPRRAPARRSPQQPKFGSVRCRPPRQASAPVRRSAPNRTQVGLRMETIRETNRISCCRKATKIGPVRPDGVDLVVAIHLADEGDSVSVRGPGRISALCEFAFVPAICRIHQPDFNISLSLTKTICDPSGDQAGRWSRPGCSVKRRRCDPSAGMV